MLPEGQMGDLAGEKMLHSHPPAAETLIVD
jgi:hypothetical protein